MSPSRADLDHPKNLDVTKLFEAGQDGSDDLIFINVVGIDIDDSLHVITVDRGLANRGPNDSMKNVHVFDSHGELLRSFGRNGDGPAELKYADLANLTQDTLRILDTRAINRFRTDGTYIDRINITAGQKSLSLQHAGVIGYTNQGVIALFGNPYDRHTANPGRDTISVGVVAADGAMQRALMRIRKEQRYKVAGGILNIPEFLGPIVYVTIGSDGAVYVNGDDGLSINRIAADGMSEERIVLDPSPVAVDKTMVNTIIDGLERSLRKKKAVFPVSINEIVRDLRAVPQAKRRAVVGRVLVSNSGTMLVERADLAPLRGTIGTSSWLLLSRDGRVKGQVAFAPGFLPMAFKDSLVAGMQKDTLDVQSVALYRIGHKN